MARGHLIPSPHQGRDSVLSPARWDPICKVQSGGCVPPIWVWGDVLAFRRSRVGATALWWMALHQAGQDEGAEAGAKGQHSFRDKNYFFLLFVSRVLEFNMWRCYTGME